MDDLEDYINESIKNYNNNKNENKAIDLAQ